VNPADLLKVSINVPRIDEQNRIAEAIDHADRVVRAEENKLVVLRAEKAALMQQLLTGKRRVRVPAMVEAEPA
jgi:type I restriction enzyme S subunit